jgi:ABC-2 type transport system permease protein
MTFLSDVWYVAWRELVIFVRTPVRIIMTVIQPLIWLGLMGNMMQGMMKGPGLGQLLGTGNYLTFMTPGIILMVVLFGGAFSGMSIVWDRRTGYLEKLLAAPISRAAIPFGKAFAAAIQAGIQILIIAVIATALGVRFATGPLGLIVILLIAMCFSLIMSSFSLSLAARIKSPETLMAIVNFLTMPLMFASNALFPKEAMPGWLATVATYNPVTYAVTAIRHLTVTGWDWLAIASSLGILVGLTIAVLTLSRFLFQRATVE